MDFKNILKIANELLVNLNEQIIDVVDIKKPATVEYAQNLAKVVSKLSPLLGNMIEFHIVEKLNGHGWNGYGKWIRQDPGFPDALFEGTVHPKPGIEIKTWFPLATEITARFKDSILHFEQDQTELVLVAWLPEYILFGRPKIIDVWVGSAKSIAIARDLHYHNPPDYLIFEPEDTSRRTINLQQTNTNGYIFQGSKKEFLEAKKIVMSWSKNGSMPYDPSPEYQKLLKDLLKRFSYRLDTNFAKIDRIEHEGIESFKKNVLNKKLFGHLIKDWSALISADESKIRYLIQDLIKT